VVTVQWQHYSLLLTALPTTYAITVTFFDRKVDDERRVKVSGEIIQLLRVEGIPENVRHVRGHQEDVGSIEICLAER
jgi:hypothetical protein